MTREQVERARDDGYTAGYALEPSRPNPYAPEHVPPWDLRRRTPAARTRLDEQQRPALILARVWQVAHRRGLDAYVAERGLARHVAR